MLKPLIAPNSHRCADCGFLSYIPHEPGAATDEAAFAAYADPTPRCFVGAYDLAGEAQGLAEGRAHPGEAAVDAVSNGDAHAYVAASEHTVQRPRRCRSFIRRRPGFDFEAHRDLKLREGDRRWTLFVALAGVIAGSSITAAIAAVIVLLTQ